jgi:hypothetical protein
MDGTDRTSKAVMPTLLADSKTDTRLTNDGVLCIVTPSETK